MGSDTYFDLLFDEGKYREVAPKITSDDLLQFKDTGLHRSPGGSQKRKLDCKTHCGLWRPGWDSGRNQLHGFQFIGGSMGSVVGEKIARGIDLALKKECPSSASANQEGPE